MLEVRNMSAAYGTAEVLRDISLDLDPGKIVALLGPNGAGKTSLIRVLNGTLRTTVGKVLLDSKNTAEMSRRQIAARITVVAQENETKFPVSVLQFVLAGRYVSGGIFGWETDEDISLANNALEQCDLAAFRDRLMNELSGGERQRVVLARALASGADILLLDEPTANLDLAHQAMMFRLVRERCRTCEHAAVVITHDLNLAAEFADEIILMRAGRALATGAPGEILTNTLIEETFGVQVALDENPISKKVRVTTIY